MQIEEKEAMDTRAIAILERKHMINIKPPLNMGEVGRHFLTLYPLLSGVFSIPYAARH